MGITTAFFHSRGTCWTFSDLLNRVVRGPTIPGPASFSNWYGISSDPDDLLAGRDRRALLTSDAQMLSKVKTEDRMEGQTGKASWLREAFEFINVSFSNSAFPLSEPTIFCDDASWNWTGEWLPYYRESCVQWQETKTALAWTVSKSVPGVVIFFKT